MRTRSLFLGVLVIASLASCSDDKVTGISPIANGEEITYSVVTNKATRATLYSNSAKPSSFYVWAVTSDGAAYISGDKVVTEDGTTYTDAAGTHYWPSESLDFYATNYTNVNLDQTSTSTFPSTFSYSVATDVASQEDLLYAVALEQGKSTNGGTVNLNFRHALSQIVFQAMNEAQLYVEITGVGVNKVSGTGTFAFPVAATTDQQTSTDYASSGIGTWSSLSESTDYTIDDLTLDPLEGKTEVTALTSGETALLLLPQEITLSEGAHHDSGGVAYLTLDCAIYNMAGTTYDAETDEQLYTGTVYFPLAISWQAGKKYTYIFDFGGSGSGNPSGETDKDEDVLTPITYSVTVDDFVETDVIEEDVTVRDLNGHEAVDLGLSVVWATCNIGADVPADYGNYYAWGEIETKAGYSMSNSTWYDVSVTEDEIKGVADYDAATANWGGTWRLPTSSEITELVNKTTYTWTTETDSKGKAVYGYKVTGPSGKSIFLPAAGYYTGTMPYAVGSGGYYWSCVPYSNLPRYTYSLYFDSSYFGLGGVALYLGFSVRPVSE